MLTKPLNAMGIAACYVPSTLHAASGGATIKDLFAGTSAATGVMAADLAKSGITGVRDWNEHWFKAMARTHDQSQLIEDLGKVWRIESGGLHFKQRAVMAVGQPVLDACEKLLRHHYIDYRLISHIRMRGARRILIGGNRHPESILSAKASAPYLAAFAFTYHTEFLDDPHFIRSLTRERLNDKRVISLAESVIVEVDEKLDHDNEVGSPQRFAAYVEVEMHDGTRFEEYADIWPHTSAMSYEDVSKKFKDVVRGMTSHGEAEYIVEEVGRLEELTDMSQVLGDLGNLGSQTSMA